MVFINLLKCQNFLLKAQCCHGDKVVINQSSEPNAAFKWGCVFHFHKKSPHENVLGYS